MTESEIEIEMDLSPIRYKIELDDLKNFDKEMRKLKSFIENNDEKLQQMASEALEARRKNDARYQQINQSNVGFRVVLYLRIFVARIYCTSNVLCK